VPQGLSDSAKGLIEHIIGTLLHIWGRVIRVGLFAGASTALGTEIVASIVSRGWPPGQAHLAAAALAVAVAYGTAATMLVSEILLGLLHTLRTIEGDVEAGALATAAIARHEAHTAGVDVWSLFGLRPVTGAQAASNAQAGTPRNVATPSPVLASPGEGSDAAMGEREYGAFAAELPPQLPPLPVRADRLPRIAWANEATLPPSASTSPTPSAQPSAPMAWEGGPVSLTDSSNTSLEERTSEIAGLAPLASIGAVAIGVATTERPTPATNEAPVEGDERTTVLSGTPVVSATQPRSEQAARDTHAAALDAQGEIRPVDTEADGDGGRSAVSDSTDGAPEFPVATLPIESRGVAGTPADAANRPGRTTRLGDAGVYDEDVPLVPPPTMTSQPLVDAETALTTETPPPTGLASPEPAPIPPTLPRPGGRPTRPLAPLVNPLAGLSSDPLAPPTGSGNLWDRLSQALKGISPAPEEETEPKPQKDEG
jgi:hypothetical protein